MRNLIVILLFILLVPNLSRGQQPVGKQGSQIFITSPDSIPHIRLSEIPVFPMDKRSFSKREFRQYSSLEAKVRKVYPLAQLAEIKIREYNKVYNSFKTDRERKSYVKKVEKELFAEFEATIRTMKVSEGRILIKLLDRQTGSNSYEIIKEFKGGLSAFFWQGIARVFGHNLKAEYDSLGEDRMIEYIVWEIEMGLI